MEHGEMRRELIAVGRVVSPPQSVEPGEIFGSDLGGNDEGPGEVQISTWLPSSTTRSGGRR